MGSTEGQKKGLAIAKTIQDLLNTLNPLASLLFGKAMARFFGGILKRLATVLVAVTLALTGIILVSIGVVEGLSVIVPRWAAYCIVGLILALIGMLLLVVGSMRH